MAGLFLFFSCGEMEIPNESSCTFQLPQKDIFVKTSKYKGGRFTIFFATDSLSLNESKDSVEFRTGGGIQIIVDTTDIYVNSHNGLTTILNMGNNNFTIGVVSDSVFMDTFFENHKRKYPYSFISIDTKEYSIGANGQAIKKGNINGGW